MWWWRWSHGKQIWLLAEVQFLQSLNFNHVNLTIVKLVGAGVLREKRNKMSKIGVKEQNNLSNAKAFFNKQSLGQKNPWWNSRGKDHIKWCSQVSQSLNIDCLMPPHSLVVHDLQSSHSQASFFIYFKPISSTRVRIHWQALRVLK